MAQETKAEGAGKKLGNNTQPNEPARFKADILPSEKTALSAERQNELNSELINATGFDNREEKIRQLIKAGADIAAKDMFGRTALQNTAQQGSASICILLIEEYKKTGRDIKELINANNVGGWSALDFAVDHGLAQVCDILIDTYANAGGDIKELIAPNKEFGSPTMRHAASRGRTHMCSLLIDAYAKAGGDIKDLVTAKDIDGNRPLQYAINNGHIETSEFLEYMESKIKGINGP